MLLDQHAAEKTKHLKAWPKTAKKLAADLRRLAPNLRAIGLGIEFAGRAGHQRRRIIKISPPLYRGRK